MGICLPPVHFLPLIDFKVAEGRLSQLSQGKRRCTPWTGHQSVLTDGDRQTFMLTFARTV